MTDGISMPPYHIEQRSTSYSSRRHARAASLLSMTTVAGALTALALAVVVLLLEFPGDVAAYPGHPGVAKEVVDPTVPYTVGPCRFTPGFLPRSFLALEAKI